MAVQINVNCAGGHVCTISVPVGSNVNSVLAAIETEAGIPAAEQRLVHGTDKWLPGGQPAALGQVTTVPLDLLLIRLNLNEDQLAWIAKIQAAGMGADGILMEAPADVRDDRDVVLSAVGLVGFALQWASEGVRGDREVVLVAVAQDGNALRWASDNLRGDRDVVLVALRQNKDALLHASDELQLEAATDPEIRQLVQG